LDDSVAQKDWDWKNSITFEEMVDKILQGYTDRSKK